jgi:hypothetical protein
VKRPAVRREADDLPARVEAEGLANRRRLRAVERLGQHRGIAQHHVEFEQDEFRNGHVVTPVQRVENRSRFDVMSIFRLNRGKENVRVD